MSTFAITVILGVSAGFTFVFQGKQWPTFILATLFGLFLGSTIVGDWLSGGVEWAAEEANQAFSNTGKGK